MLGRIVQYIGSHGVGYTLYHAGELLQDRLNHPWDRLWNECLKPSEEELERERRNPVPGVGRISVIIPVYNTRPELLTALGESLLAQTWADWEACMYDGCSTNPQTQDALRRLEARDSRFRITYGKENAGIAGNSNLALEQATGAWIALCDHDDLLTPDALWRMAEAIHDTGAELFYSDEDKVDESGQLHHSPHFKPDFCPDNLRSGNYICHLMVMSRSLIDRAGRFRPGFDGSQDHDLVLRCIEKTDKVVHIPRILYHWRTLNSSASHQNLQKCVDAACRATQEHMERIGWPGTVSQVNGQPRLCYRIRPGAKIDIIVIESGDPKLWSTLRHELKRVNGPDICFTFISPWRDSTLDADGSRWIEWHPGESLYSCMNRAARAAEGEFLLFLHGSIAMEGDSWLDELQMYAQRDDVGAVTGRILNIGGHILHGGFAVGVNGYAACRGKGLPAGAGGWHGMMTTSHNVAAVAPVCMMIRRDHFIPMDERYQGGLGCVDWCLKLVQNGMRHVYTPYASGRMSDCGIRESLLLSQPAPEPDAALFRQAWGENIKDPCYSRFWSRRDGQYRLPDASELRARTEE